MASLYKKPVTITDERTGKRVKTKSKKWWGRFKDELGREKRVPLATDKTAAQAMLNELVRKVEYRAAGLVDPYDEHRRRPLVEHVDDFVIYLTHKGASRAYVDRTRQQVRHIVRECRFATVDEINASRVQSALSALRFKGLSVNSVNHYVRAVKMFTRWLVRDRRNVEDRLLHLSTNNPEIDRRRVRRPLSPEEFQWLIDTTTSAPDIQGISGRDRVILYILACYTGFRRNEIGSVTPRSFSFESQPPTLTIEAAYSKHRRRDVLPVRVDLAARIKAWLVTKDVTDDESILDITGKRTAEMLKKDLARARVAWLDESTNPVERKRRESTSFLQYVNDAGQVVDFHALRKTFITNLTKAGVSPKTAQLLARHCDINLTMNTYTMLGVVDQAAAVEALPAVPGERTSGARHSTSRASA